MVKYIYEYPNWPRFEWDEQKVQLLLGKVRHLQGKILGQMSALGFSEKEEAILSTLTLDVIKSSEIEGESLNYDQVRSSIARRLGINIAGLVHSSRDVEGVVEMLLDATQNFEAPLDDDRLFGWHSALFPSGRSGMHKIDVGKYRSGEMAIVSDPMGKEKIHYQAPSPVKVQNYMDQLLEWFNSGNNIDPVLKAAIAHFWFIIIHPFDDGNGRMARALSDLLLARSDGSHQRFYSLSNQILLERKEYYDLLQKEQYSDGDITKWLVWFLNCLNRALNASETLLDKVFIKTNFWEKHKETELNSRQRLMINKLLDGFNGKLKTSKWARITKCSQDTALRDIKDLINKGILRQEESGGRSTNYEIIEK
jgi:Fic family protein